ncbi:protein diaphanous homolog 3 isoform X1 [Tachysurus ichikawai]
MFSPERDRFASIRIPGSKKERTHLSHMNKQSSYEWSTSCEFEDLSSRITSEKEILALFEKMMFVLYPVVKKHVNKQIGTSEPW